jgi:hypothetical protein
MKVRLILLVLLLSTACQSGLIPCPRVKTAKIKRNYVNKPMRQYIASLSANAETEDASKNIHYKSSKGTDNLPVKNITVEEWDCPRPGAKKYMPRTVKDNIKRNFKKINSDSKVSSDSVNTVR